MKRGEETYRSVYIRTWNAINFLSENDHMDFFDGKIVWIFGFISVVAGILYLGMALWNLIEPNLKVEGIYVLFTIAGLSFLTIICYIVFLSLHNHEVVTMKTTLAETQEFYPEIWEIVKGHTEYSLIPDEIQKLDKALVKKVDKPVAPVEKTVKPASTKPTATPVLSLPEEASLDYDELIKDKVVASYLEVEQNAASFEDLLNGWKAIEEGGNKNA